jgi:Family of unknown function (DUF5999)
MTVTDLATYRRTTQNQRPECRHEPRCPAADASDHAAARVVASHPVQGWSLLCNGVVVFDDAGELLPNRVSVAPARPEYRPRPQYLPRAA